MVIEVIRLCPFATYLPIIWSHLLFTIVVLGGIDSISEYSNIEISADIFIRESESIFLSAFVMFLSSEKIIFMFPLGICIRFALWGLFYCTRRETVRSHNLINQISCGGRVSPNINISVAQSPGSDKGSYMNIVIVYFIFFSLHTLVLKELTGKYTNDHRF